MTCFEMDKTVMENIALTAASESPASCADDAVGLPFRSWFVAIVNHHSEKKASGLLQEEGYETYVPAREAVSRWKDGRIKVREQLLLPGKVFVRATERERKLIVQREFIYRFLMDPAREKDAFGRHPVATVPDAQMERLKFMLGQSDTAVTIEPSCLQKGDRVRVVRGSLMGLEGFVSAAKEGKSKVSILIDHIGCASVFLDKIDLERI